MKNEKDLISQEIYDALPEELKKLTENFEDRERDIVLLSSVGVLSNCLPNVYGNYDGDVVYPQLYIVIIAPAASGKGVMNYSRALIQPIHKKMYKDSKDKIKEYSKKNKGKYKEENKGKAPELNVKFLPANISTSEMYSFLSRSKHGLIIIESEADTMSNMLSNDWSNYSDVLRRAFHHEPISISRKMENLYEEIEEPKLAILISGTPEQLKPLIKSTENGLYSRLVVYNFNEISEFKDIFAEKTKVGKMAFGDIGQQVFEFYGRLVKLEEPIEFMLTSSQKENFRERLTNVRNDIVTNYNENFVSNLFRHGLIFFRIAMVITSLRNIKELHTQKEITCSDSDFKLAMNLTLFLLRHSQKVFDSYNSNSLTVQEGELISQLNDTFTSQDAYKVGRLYQVSERVMIDKLYQWVRKGLIKRVKKGSYTKNNVKP